MNPFDYRPSLSEFRPLLIMNLPLNYMEKYLHSYLPEEAPFGMVAILGS